MVLEKKKVFGIEVLKEYEIDDIKILFGKTEINLFFKKIELDSKDFNVLFKIMINLIRFKAKIKLVLGINLLSTGVVKKIKLKTEFIDNFNALKLLVSLDNRNSDSFYRVNEDSGTLIGLDFRFSEDLDNFLNTDTFILNIVREEGITSIISKTKNGDSNKI
jgi:hypothetical protein